MDISVSKIRKKFVKIIKDGIAEGIGEKLFKNL